MLALEEIQLMEVHLRDILEKFEQDDQTKANIDDR